jgi:diguanylate cyclase (GGDEF)-like protein
MDNQRASCNVITLLLNEIKHLQHCITLLQGTMATIQPLINSFNLNATLHQTLKGIGNLMEADRVYLFENSDDRTTTATPIQPFLYWVRGGGRVTLHHLPWQNCADFLNTDWYSLLATKQPVYISAADYSTLDRLRLNVSGVCSMLLLPIFINELFWGYIGLETLHRIKHWDAHEESLLTTMATAIGTALNNQQSHAQLEQSDPHDSLTGLPNRALFINRLEQLSRQARQDPDQHFAVVLIDFDRFKPIHDTLGQAVADRLLCEIAQRLVANVRPDDIVARWEGDQFVVLLNPICRTDDVTLIAERLRQALNQTFYIDDHPLKPKPSIGIVLSNQENADAAELIQQADRARYFAKLAGKGQYQIFDTLANADVISLTQLAADMGSALQHRDFQVYYQPIFHLSTGRLQGFEALLRWQHIQHGFIQPDVFIPMAEETGIIDELDHFVLAESCAQLRRWHESYPEQYPLTLNVNVAIQEIQQSGFANKLAHLLRREHLKPHHLHIELTESKVFEEDPRVLTTLHQLMDMGIQLQLDSLGIGYSCLSCLHHLPFRTLKIDRSFIERIETGVQGQGMVSAIVNLAHALQVDVIAEGIETQFQFNFLRSLPCSYGQGYWYSQPLSPEQAEYFLWEYATTHH